MSAGPEKPVGEAPEAEGEHRIRIGHGMQREVAHARACLTGRAAPQHRLDTHPTHATPEPAGWTGQLQGVTDSLSSILDQGLATASDAVRSGTALASAEANKAAEQAKVRVGGGG